MAPVVGVGVISVILTLSNFFMLTILYHVFLCCSLFILKSVVIPILLWILPDQTEQFAAEHLSCHKAALALYSFLRFILIELFYVSLATMHFIKFIISYLISSLFSSVIIHVLYLLMLN